MLGLQSVCLQASGWEEGADVWCEPHTDEWEWGHATTRLF